MRTLELPPVVDALESRTARGLALFLFVLEHGSPAAALLDRDACELTRYAARIASDNRGASAQYYDRVAAAEREITARARAIDAADVAARVAAPVVGAPAPAVTVTPDSDRPNDGPMAPLTPRPRVTPPAPALAAPVVDW